MTLVQPRSRPMLQGHGTVSTALKHYKPRNKRRGGGDHWQWLQIGTNDLHAFSFKCGRYRLFTTTLLVRRPLNFDRTTFIRNLLECEWWMEMETQTEKDGDNTLRSTVSGGTHHPPFLDRVISSQSLFVTIRQQSVTFSRLTYNQSEQSSLATGAKATPTSMLIFAVWRELKLSSQVCVCVRNRQTDRHRHKQRQRDREK